MEINRPDIHKIWHELHPDLHRYICHRVDHQDHCHDILQDVFLKIASTGLPDDIRNIKGYLVRTATHTIADHYRKKRPVPADTRLLIDEDHDIQHHAEYISNRFLNECISALPGPYREALIKTELQGMSQKQYADLANISLSGAKSRVQRARIKLKEMILSCCGFRFDKYGNVVFCCGEETTGNCCR